ncbi:BolA-like protein 3 [Geosmithia morbida]|uniref:BolA-like protein 3 n=1 Tax=Geosmithia morbida TaxID=1094350 RepID=A0A9P4YPL0_9HYPO|nr:BolA-like protein 3 [Geosmithia morbida]KAF4119398.1 BolA-like protein 3 [Geosmithia morbida]
MFLRRNPLLSRRLIAAVPRVAIPATATAAAAATSPRLSFPSATTAGQSRAFSSDDAVSSMTEAESAIASTITSFEALDPISSILVRDVSGGCGSMYAIEVASRRFKGMNLLAQQRLVNKALGDQVKNWHGVQIRTRVPEEGE